MAAPMMVLSPDAGEMARRAAQAFVGNAQMAIDARGKFVVALSGGSTPKALYETLAMPEYKLKVRWGKVHVFWGDERCVPPEHEQSNYRMAHEALLGSTGATLHRVQGELGAKAAAAAYEVELKETLGPDGVFDLVLLGVGEDGHTASLFPGGAAIDETARLAVTVTDREPQRVSLTLPVINAAREVMFLVSGASKGPILKRVLGGDPTLPAARVQPANGKLTLYIDEPAAAELFKQ